MNYADLLFNAIRKGSAEAVRDLLVTRAFLVNTNDARGFTPLVLASYLGHLDITKLLVEAGAELDAAGPAGTALMGVCFRGYPQIARYLVEAGADVNVRGPQGKTALHFAAEYNQPGIVVGLLQSGADAGARDEAGLTPAEGAAAAGHAGVVEVFAGEGG